METMMKRSAGLPLTTKHTGVYKRKYFVRFFFQSIAFVALVIGYVFYNKAFPLEGLQQLGHVRPSDDGPYGSLPRRLMAIADATAETTASMDSHENRTYEDHHDAVFEAACADLEKADSWWKTILYFLGVLYCFLAIALVCDNFFVEALDEIASPRHMNIDRDVAGATLMAAGGSAPELFANLIGTFQESAIGFGTVLGSAAFNVLFVIAACALFAKEELGLTWWPLFRDATCYAATLIVLALFVGLVSPNEIEWWEALVLLALYISYVLVCKNNATFYKFFTGKDLVEPGMKDGSSETRDEDGESAEDEFEPFGAPWLPPTEDGCFAVLWHLIQLPILIVLTLTIPDVRRPGMGGYCYASFGISILWIGFIAWWMVLWVEIIGNTISVPSVVMGYTLLAAGTSVPDLLTSILVTRQGHADMAISSSIGSNIFDVAFGLPVPWLLFMAVHQKSIKVDSAGIWVSIMVFLGMLALVVGLIHGHKWKLSKALGGMMFILYIVFLVQAIWLELPFPC